MESLTQIKKKINLIYSINQINFINYEIWNIKNGYILNFI